MESSDESRKEELRDLNEKGEYDPQTTGGKILNNPFASAAIGAVAKPAVEYGLSHVLPKRASVKQAVDWKRLGINTAGGTLGALIGAYGADALNAFGYPGRDEYSSYHNKIYGGLAGAPTGAVLADLIFNRQQKQRKKNDEENT